MIRQQGGRLHVKGMMSMSVKTKSERIVGRTMTPRERVLAAGGHRRPDRCPMDFGGTAMSLCKPEFLAKLRDELGYRLPEDRDADGVWVDESIQRYLGVDLRWVPFAPPLAVLRELDPAAYQTAKAAHEREKIAAAAATIKTTAVTHDHPLAALSLDDIRKLPVTRREPLAYADWTIQTAKQFRADGFATTYWVSGGFFEQGCAGRGYDQFAMDLAGDPDLVRALFDNWLLNKLSQVEMVVKPLAPYIDWFCFGDDLGLQTGPFMSPATFQELIKPYMAEYYQQVRAAAPDALIFHHSCGSVYRLLDDLIDIGVNVLNPIQPNAFEMEPERLKEKARGRLCLHGGIDLQHLLPFGSPQEVRDETARRMRILGEDGGYVCAPAHSLPEDVPSENILAMFGK
jgi:uroporphyrinogen decarboxylase